MPVVDVVGKVRQMGSSKGFESIEITNAGIAPGYGLFAFSSDYNVAGVSGAYTLLAVQQHNYISIKDVYNNIRSVLYKKINYSLYYNIIKRYFEILIRDAVERGREVSLPNQMGYVYLDERPHKRAFHIRRDVQASKEQGEFVHFRVPILDDFYKKLIWVRPTKYRNCKIMPLGYSKRIINKD